MGVPGIHLEQTLGPFGEKPGGPFFVPAMRTGWRIYGIGEMMKKVAIFFIIPGQKPIIETP